MTVTLTPALAAQMNALADVLHWDEVRVNRSGDTFTVSLHFEGVSVYRFHIELKDGHSARLTGLARPGAPNKLPFKVM